MSMVIGTNIGSLSAQRHLAASKGDMDSAMERLSSGSRINSSRDDAAGLAISGRMTSQINGLNQAVRNANDGISLAQSAEGALDETTTILQRMRELSVQASSSTLTTSDRSSIQAEVSELTTELDRISDVTTFNNIKLLNGNADDLQFQVGATAGESVSLTITGSSASALGLTDGSTSGSVAAINGTNMTTLAGLYGNSVELNGKDWATPALPSAVVGATLAVTNADGVAVNAKTTTADGVAAIINDGTDRHGVVATASNSVMSTAAIVDDSLTVTGLTIGGAAIDTSTNITELVANINNQAVGAQARMIDDTHFELYNTTGEDIIIAGATTNSGLTASAGTNVGSLSLSNTDGSATLITRGDHSSSSSADVNALGFNEREAPSSITSAGISGSKLTLAADDLTLNGVAIAPSTNPAANATAATLAAHINTFTSDTDVVASAATKVTMVMDSVNDGGVWKVNSTVVAESLVINGITMSIGSTTQPTVAQVVTDLNTALASAGITATQDEGKIVLEHSLGNTITIDEASATVSNIAMLERSDGSTVAATAGSATADSFTGNLTLTNQEGGGIKFDTVHGTDAELQLTLDKLGLQAQGSTDQVETAGAGLSMETTASANLAITALDAALEKVFASRGDLGAFQNRLDHTVSNLRNVSENMSAARSQIMDTDFATESANLAKAQVLQQAGTAMLAQANASGQSVLSLLK
jgi:flagellin